MPPRIHYAKIIYNRSVGPGFFRMLLACPNAAREARPGQFIMLQVSDSTDPLLRRPFSLCGIGNDTIEILFRIAGKGTSLMASWRPEQIVNFIGPLGRGFEIPETAQAIYIIAGGIGIAPLLALTQSIEQNKTIPDTCIFFGGKTAEDVAVIEDFKPLSATVFTATENGSQGFHGLVTDLFLNHLQQQRDADIDRTGVFGCGPQSMARVLGAIAGKHRIACQLSLESMMACGVGSCLGCVVKTQTIQGSGCQQPSEPGSFQYRRVCAEGPVFDSRELVWDD
ncbi:MAG: dihydroorotate dehydrogenase electron transfer subunit [Proteobacteria bacterium]|nr:dihydroorotate dehydrogenase electron transfer subunit [Pseudomonadota bacterium]